MKTEHYKLQVKTSSLHNDDIDYYITALLCTWADHNLG